MAKNDKMKTGEFEFSDEFDIPDFDFGGTEPEDDRKPITKVVDGLKTGAKAAITDSGTLKRLVKASLPEAYGETFDTATGVYKGIGDAVSSAVDEVKPAAADFSRSLKKLVPAEAKRTQALLDKIEEWGGGSKINQGPNIEEQRRTNRELEMAEIFKAQEEISAKQQEEQNVKDRLNTSLNIMQHRDSMQALNAIAASSHQQAQYVTRVNAAWQKKTLELNFRTLDTQLDILTELKRSSAENKQYQATIAKNTGLPDYVKTRTTERFGEMLRDRFVGAASQFGMGNSEFVRRAMEVASTKIRRTGNDIAQAFQAGAMGADMVDLMQSMEMGPKKDNIEKGAEYIGEYGLKGLAHQLGKSLNGKARKNRHIAKGADFLRYYNGNIGGVARDFAQGGAWDEEYTNPILNKLREVMGWMMPNMGTETELGKDTGLDVRAPAAYNQLAQKSITEIIPGYLSRILREIYVLRTGDESASAVVYDHHRNRFVTQTTLAKDIKDSMVEERVSKYMGDRFTQQMDEIDKDKQLSPEARRALMEMMLREHGNNRTMDLGKMSSADYFRNTVTGAHADELAALFKKYGESTEDGKLGNSPEAYKKRADFAEFQSWLGRQVRHPGSIAQRAVNQGNIDALREAGLLDDNDNLDFDKIIKQILDQSGVANSDILIKENITKIAPKDALSRIKKIGTSMWNYKKGSRADDGQQVHFGPMAQDVQRRLGEQYAPKGKKIDLVSMNGATMAATQAVDDKVEALSKKIDRDRLDEALGSKDTLGRGFGKSYYDRQRNAYVGGAEDVRIKAQKTDPQSVRDEMLRIGYTPEQLKIGYSAMGETQDTIQEEKQLVQSYSDNVIKQLEIANQIAEYAADRLDTLVDLAARTFKSAIDPNYEHTGGDKPSFREKVLSKMGFKPKARSKWVKTPETRGEKLSSIFGNAADLAGDLGGAAYQTGKAAAGFGWRNMLRMNRMAGAAGRYAWKKAQSGFDRLRKQADVWIGDELSPRLKVGKLKAGRYLDEATGKIVTSYEELTGNIRDLDTNEIVLYADELKRCLVKNNITGKVIEIGKWFKNLAIDQFHAGTNRLSWMVRQAKAAVKSGARLGAQLLDPPRDVYVKGEDKPRLYVGVMKNGGYIDVNSEKIIERPSQIKGAVRDKDGIVISEEDFRKGLVDEFGKPFYSPGMKLLGVGLATAKWSLGKLKNIGTFAWDQLGKGAQGTFDLMRGIGDIFRDAINVSFGDKAVPILEQIRDILKERLPEQQKKVLGDTDGDGIRENSWKDKMQERLRLGYDGEGQGGKPGYELRDGPKARKYETVNTFDLMAEKAGAVKDWLGEKAGQAGDLWEDWQDRRRGGEGRRGRRGRMGRGQARLPGPPKGKLARIGGAAMRGGGMLARGAGGLLSLAGPLAGPLGGALATAGGGALTTLGNLPALGGPDNMSTVPSRHRAETRAQRMERESIQSRMKGRMAQDIDDVKIKSPKTRGPAVPKQLGGVARGAGQAAGAARGAGMLSRAGGLLSRLGISGGSKIPLLGALIAASYGGYKTYQGYKNDGGWGAADGLLEAGENVMLPGLDIPFKAMRGGLNYIRQHGQRQEGLPEEEREGLLSAAARDTWNGAKRMGNRASKRLEKMGAKFGGAVTDVLTSPWLGPIGMAGWAVKKAWNKFGPKKDMSTAPFATLRLLQYGVGSQDHDYHSKLFELENFLGKYTSIDSEGKAKINAKSFSQAEIFDILEVQESNQEKVEMLLDWLEGRFKPVYLAHKSALHALNVKSFEAIDKEMVAVKLKYLSMVENAGSPWSVSSSPFPDSKRLNNKSAPITEFVKGLRAMFEDEKGKEGKKDELAAQFGGAGKMDPQMAAAMGGTAAKALADASKLATVDSKDPNAKQQATLGKLVGQISPSGLILSGDKDKGNNNLTTVVSDPVQQYMRNQVSALEAVRFKTYGLGKFIANQVLSLRALETFVQEGIQFDKAAKQAKWTGDWNKTRERAAPMFGVALNDTGQQFAWMEWFLKRFLPAYTTYISYIYDRTGMIGQSKAENALTNPMALDVANKLVSMKNVWEIQASPWKGTELNVDTNTAEENIQFIKDVIKDQEIAQQKAKKANEEALAAAAAAGKPSTTAPANVKAQGTLNTMVKDNAKTTGGTDHFEGDEVEPTPAEKGGGSVTITSAVGGGGNVPHAGGPMSTGGAAEQWLQLGKGVNIGGLHPELLKLLRGAAQEYGEKTGKKLVINSGFRSYADQARLHKQDPKKAAPPGRSLHEVGLAFDASSAALNEMEKLGILRKYGLTRPVGGEPWHVEPAGIQGDIKGFRADPQSANAAIVAGIGKGGGGMGTDPRAAKYQRNTELAKNLLKMKTQPQAEKKDADGGTVPTQVAAADAMKKAGEATPQAPKGAGAGGGAGGSPDAEGKPKGAGPALGGSIAKMESLPTVDGVGSAKNTAPGSAGSYESIPSISGKGYQGAKATIDAASKIAGVDPREAATIAAVESSFNANARPTGAGMNSSATGLFQFTKDTWEGVSKKYGSQYGIPSGTPATDPRANALMGALHLRDNKKLAARLKGQPATAIDAYALHMLGQPDATKLFKAQGDAKAASILPGPAASNRPVFYHKSGEPRTISELMQFYGDKLNKAAAAFGIEGAPGGIISAAKAQSTPGDVKADLGKPKVAPPAAPAASFVAEVNNKTLPPAPPPAVAPPPSTRQVVDSALGDMNRKPVGTSGIQRDQSRVELLTATTSIQKTLDDSLQVQRDMLTELRTMTGKMAEVAKAGAAPAAPTAPAPEAPKNEPRKGPAPRSYAGNRSPQTLPDVPVSMRHTYT